VSATFVELVFDIGGTMIIFNLVWLRVNLLAFNQLEMFSKSSETLRLKGY